MRIGLIADTHEVRAPRSLIQQLEASACQLNVHLGDIGGSWLITEIVREFKRENNLNALSEAQRARFAQHRAAGLTPVAAYIEAFLGDDRGLRVRRRQEIRQSYDETVGAISRLPKSMFLAGNVDRVLLRMEGNREAVERHQARLVTAPRLWEEDGAALLAYPSLTHTEHGLPGWETIRAEAARLANRLGLVVVLAHEQLFRGPTPDCYRTRAARQGYQPTTVPYFEPNPGWPGLLGLFRDLDCDVEAAFVSGHVHDPQQVIQAGVSYLRGSVAEGLRFRLWGVSNGQEDGAARCHGRRLIRHFHVPAGRIAILTLEDGRVSLQLLPPPDQAD